VAAAVRALEHPAVPCPGIERGRGRRVDRQGKNVSAFGPNYSVKADFSVWPDLRNTLLAGYVGL
jgi:hypothetical protein